MSLPGGEYLSLASTEEGVSRESISRQPDEGTEYDMLRELVRFFSIYFTMVVIASGIFGNILSIIVFIRLRKKDAVTATYLTPISVYDLTNTGVGLANWLAQAVPAFSGGTIYLSEAVSDVHCKVRVYISMAAGLMSVWTLVVFCIERCIAIWLPLKVAILVTSTRRKIVLFLVVVFSLGLAYTVVPAFRLFGTICIPKPRTQLESILYGVTDYGFYAGMPILALCVLNALLVCGLSRQDKALKLDKKGSKAKTNDHKIVRNLFLISCVCIVTMTPFCVVGSIQIARNSLGWGDTSKEYISIFNMMVKLTFLFHYANFSANYLIYAASLDFYRAECKKLFSCFWVFKRK